MAGGAGTGRDGPAGLARRLGTRRDKRAASPAAPRATPRVDDWRRESFALPGAEARRVARDWFDRFPKAAFRTEIESWRERPDGVVEFTMRRLAGAP